MTDKTLQPSAICLMGTSRSRAGFRTILLVATVGLIAAACNPSDKSDQEADASTAAMPQTAGNAAVPADASAPMNLVPAEYVGLAASGDMFEIQSSELALEVSQSNEVRSFAQQMIDAHKATTAQLASAVEGTGFALPAEMQPRHAAMLDALRAARGDAAQFDRLYLEQQTVAHAEAMELHRNMATRSDLPGQLAVFARETLPKVEGHHAMLAGMPAAQKPAAAG